ncbi:MAG: hypothetical protein H7Z43_00170, partial [Clostridia bacterium]|nr:hypothetical protein [Deltaproteobacteria bacterium]
MIRRRICKPCARAMPHAFRWWLPASALSLMMFGASVAHAERLDDLLGKDTISSNPLILMTALAVFSLVPFVLIMVTSFVKIAVVLSIVRQAIGTQQIPPTQVITGLATILTV